MHGWQEHGWGGGRWVVAIVLMVLFWGAVATIVIALVRTRSHPQDGRTEASNPATPTSNAEQILHDRFARGEIDDDEYVRRHDLLKQRSR